MDLAHVDMIDLGVAKMIYLFVLGLAGGLMSGFIGSGGAFVLTPGMMSIGAPALVAVASNMCHKFPKALVGAIKRRKYGHVDIKLGLVMGASAEAGVLYGAHLQQRIREAFGSAGSDLYVSAVFVIVLAVVGSLVLKDAVRSRSRCGEGEDETVTRLSKWVRSVRIPGTMMYFRSLNARISVLLTIPLGFATGLLAATIAVGGFVGVPSLIYVLGVPSLVASGTELVIAFVMGLGGSFKYALHGLVDIRLTLLILAGSLFGVQLGAIGTTYVRPYMIKMVMGIVMLIVLVSRALTIPIYLAELDLVEQFPPSTVYYLRHASSVVMVCAVLASSAAILGAMWRGSRRCASGGC